MKISQLQKILEDAKPFANIEIELQRYTTYQKALVAQGAASMIEHFAQTGRFAILSANKDKNTVVIAKTQLFKTPDAAELSKHIAEFVIKAEARDVPEHCIVLEQGNNGWQLRFTGANKLAREIFKATCDMTKRFFGFAAIVLSDKEGTAILDLSRGDDNSVLQFSETVAENFNTALSM